MRLFKRLTNPSAPTSGYLPGLDGLRALAVMAVLFFHGGVALFTGGFLGVEVFFVVSGYLITLLLLREHDKSGSINLKAFWGRRARRLLPAVFTLIALTLVYALIFLPEEVGGLRKDALSAVVYVTNWWLVFGNQPYFEVMGRPSLLQHLWSLAVEEQFYLVWPVVFFALLRFAGRRGALLATLVAAVGSYLLMGALHSPEVDPARVYYGTDTRAGGLLLGAALAMVWDPRMARRSPYPNIRMAISVLGVIPVAVVAWVIFTIEPSTSWLYPWGFVMLGLGTVATIFVATHPSAEGLQRILGSAPMRWAGIRSYGIYLWHWPIFQVTRPGLDVHLDGLDLLLGRLALTFLAAEVSYRLIERPFRTGVAWRDIRTMFEHAPVRARLVTAMGSVAAFALVFSTVYANGSQPPEYLARGDFHGVVGPTISPAAAGPTNTPTASPTATATASPTATATPRPIEGPALPEATATPTVTPTPPPPPPTNTPTPVPPQPTAPPAPPPPPPPPPSNAPILAIGDSVLIDAAPYMGVVGTVEIDAAIGRQANVILGILQQRQAEGRIPGVVIIHAGNNGPLTVGMVDRMIEAAQGSTIVLVTDRVGRSWEAGNNEIIRSMPGRWGANVRVADWYAATEGHPELFFKDGIHVGGEGGQLYANLVANAAA